MILDEKISPSLVKSLTLTEKEILCGEIRRYIIETVTKNGGHLASNLGTVELIVAFHSVFSTPQDKIVFDVGHQAYTHKIITGRYSEFQRLRSSGGISGFPRPKESVHDAFVAGHSGISLSAALGICEAMLFNGTEGKVVAIAGDGAFTNGEIYEGLNNICARHKNLIVILNDNEMSISRNSGAIAGYLANLRANIKYNQTKAIVKGSLDKSQIGKEVSHTISGVKRIVKSALIPDNLFENLGFKYYGPVDGHNLEDLIKVFRVAQALSVPCFIHIKTLKGKGFVPAENNAGQHHAVSKSARTRAEKADTFSHVFGRELLFLANRDDRICAVTAAMKYATGCNYFSKQYLERFFDVGIAEGHAITFSAGLASQGMLPVTAIYSTFLQRGYDQLIHDAAIENIHLVLAVDRAGLAGEDGETHQGTFDVPMLMSVPGSTIFSPSNADELRLCLERAVYDEKGVTAVRYPKGICPAAQYGPVKTDYRYTNNSSRILIVTYGRMINTVNRLASLSADVLQLIQIKPIKNEVIDIVQKYSRVFFVEESTELGGVGAALLVRLSKKGWRGEYNLRAINGFVPYGDIETQMRICGLDYYSLAKFIFNKEMAEEKRLDVMTAQLGIARSRTVAQELIKKGGISVNGKISKKPSELVKGKDEIKLVGELPKYVSRGGLKLEKAIEAFGLNLRGLVCLDVGASTGGFTDCMLQNGAMTVYTVDVGTNQLDSKLKNDDRVISFEQLDIREAEDVILKKFDFISIDVSFISLKHVIPKISGFMSGRTTVVALIKPQFEMGKKHIKNGIVHDKGEREDVIAGISEFIKGQGFRVAGVIPADTGGKDMNVEYLICFSAN